MNFLHSKIERAFGEGDLEECRSLIGAGLEALPSSSDQASWFRSAIRAGHHARELVELLLRIGLNPNSVYDEIGEDYQNTPAVAAASVGRLDILNLLVNAGADIRWSSPTGANAASESLPSRSIQAYLADTSGLAETRAWLLEQGVRLDPDCTDSRRKLIWAASNPCSWPDIPMLLELGVKEAPLKWSSFMMKLTRGDASVEDADAVSDLELVKEDCWQRTPFLMAVSAGRLDLAERLLVKGSDWEAKAWCGASALHLAARHDHINLVGWLLSLGMRVDVLNDFKNTPLRDAVSFNSLASARCFLEHGAHRDGGVGNDFRAIHEAHSQEMITLLLEAGADVNDVSGGGTWPLKDACARGDYSLVKYLLDQGANPNLTSTGETALFDAVQSDSIECVQALLDAGTDVNAMDCDGWTCLYKLKSSPMTHLLLANGADPSLADQVGQLPEDWLIPTPASALLKEFRLKTSDASGCC